MVRLWFRTLEIDKRGLNCNKRLKITRISCIDSYGLTLMLLFITQATNFREASAFSKFNLFHQNSAWHLMSFHMKQNLRLKTDVHRFEHSDILTSISLDHEDAQLVSGTCTMLKNKTEIACWSLCGIISTICNVSPRHWPLSCFSLETFVGTKLWYQTKKNHHLDRKTNRNSISTPSVYTTSLTRFFQRCRSLLMPLLIYSAAHLAIQRAQPASRFKRCKLDTDLHAAS